MENVIGILLQFVYLCRAVKEFRPSFTHLSKVLMNIEWHAFLSHSVHSRSLAGAMRVIEWRRTWYDIDAIRAGRFLAYKNGIIGANDTLAQFLVGENRGGTSAAAGNDAIALVA